MNQRQSVQQQPQQQDLQQQEPDQDLLREENSEESDNPALRHDNDMEESDC